MGENGVEVWQLLPIETLRHLVLLKAFRIVYGKCTKDDIMDLVTYSNFLYKRLGYENEGKAHA